MKIVLLPIFHGGNHAKNGNAKLKWHRVPSITKRSCYEGKIFWPEMFLFFYQKQGYGRVCHLAKWCLSQFLDEIRTKSIATPSGWDLVYWNYPKTLNQVSQTVCPYPFTLLHQRGTVRIRCLAMNIRKWSGQVFNQESSKPTVRPPRLPS